MRKAFTLIELLVVISIIALLIAILLPTLGAARQLAIRIQCLSQVRSLGQASAAYAADNNGAFPQRERENSTYGLGFPHRMYDPAEFDLNETFFKDYMPVTITLGTDREGDEVLFCPGDLYATRNPSLSQYAYTFISYQYFRFRQGDPSWAYTEDGIIKQPDLTGKDPIEASNYPIWGDLTVFSNSTYLGHDAAATAEEPSGMNVAYGDGSAFWAAWNDCGVYFDRTDQQYYWSEVPD